MTRTEEVAAEALALLTECIELGVFSDAAAWCEDNCDYEGSSAACILRTRVEALLEGDL